MTRIVDEANGSRAREEWAQHSPELRAHPEGVALEAGLSCIGKLKDAVATS